jgi:hypothetical protein
MAPVLNKSSLVWVAWTNILSAGKDTDVVSWSGSDLTLMMGLHVDLGMFGKGYDFSANFRVVEAASGQAFNHYWNGKLDGLKQWAPSMWLSMSWAKAEWAGVKNSHYAVFGTNKGDGLYLYRPYFLVYAGELDVEFIIFSGNSEFGVAEEHYFLLESGN